MIDEYSLTIGIGVGFTFAGIWRWAQLVRDREIARMHRSGIQFDRYFAEEPTEEEPAQPNQVASSLSLQLYPSNAAQPTGQSRSQWEGGA